MARHDYPDFFAACLMTNDEAMRRIVRTGASLGAGFATSEPPTLYEHLWDHILRHDITDFTLRQALFLAPYKFCVGEAMSSRGLLGGLTDTPGFAGQVIKKVNGITKKLEGLRKLVAHFEELRRRRIRVISSFLGPTNNMVLPDNALVRGLFPDYAGRNTTRMGITDPQIVHFPHALEAFGYTPDGESKLDAFACVLTPPNAQGLMSPGPANGANGELLDVYLTRLDTEVLVYVNPHYPFTYGYGDAPHTVHIDRFRALAEAGKLMVVEDDAPVPSMPAGSFANPAKEEVVIAEAVVNHMEMHKSLTFGRAIQVGIGQTGVQAIKALRASSWWGRQYSEMLEPFTYELLELGKIKGTHFIERDGSRTELDGKIVATFSIAEEGSDFYKKLDGNERVIFAPASRVVIPEGFYGGLGINNALGIDFFGQINSGSRDRNTYSGIGGAAMITRGLGRGGVGYFCLKSTHRTPEGKLRSSIFPYLPEGTTVSLIGPDTRGASGGARFYLVTEYGIALLTGVSQSELIRNLIAVAHPDFRDWLKTRAWEEFRVRV